MKAKTKRISSFVKELNNNKFIKKLNKKNPFQVSKEQLSYIKKNYDIIISLNINDWFLETNLLFQKTSIMYKILTDPNKSWENHSSKAEAFVDKFTERTKTIRFLDGHGRFLWHILNAMTTKSLDISNYIFEVYELDDYTYKWHQHFFPLHVKCIKGDILTGDDLDDSVAVFLNFCGITKNWIDGLDDYIEYYQDMIPLFITFDQRNQIKIGDETLNSYLKNIAKNNGTYMSTYNKTILSIECKNFKF